MNICIIPARTASKRIPNKNIKYFNGFPIIEYPYHTALDSGLFKEIIISTDSDKIHEMFKVRCPVIRRPAHLAEDKTPLIDVVLHAIEETGFKKIKNVCLMLPTSVFVKEEDLKKASKMLNNKDAVISVCEFPHPIERGFFMNNALLKMIMPEHRNTRTQDLPKKYYDAGQFYWMDYESLMEQKKIFMDRLVPYIMHAIDIDDEQDWIRAEAMFEPTRKIMV